MEGVSGCDSRGCDRHESCPNRPTMSAAAHLFLRKVRFWACNIAFLDLTGPFFKGEGRSYDFLHNFTKQLCHRDHCKVFESGFILVQLLHGI